jgi:hypothetical protein
MLPIKNSSMLISVSENFLVESEPIEFEIKDTTDTDRSASYLDLHLEIGSEGRLRTTPDDKRDYFNFPIVNRYSITVSQVIVATVKLSK